MKKENDEIADLFRSRLGHSEMAVRNGFWESLDEEAASCIRRHRRILFFRVAAAASVLFVLGVSSAAFWYFSPREEIGEAFTQLAVSEVGTLNGDGISASFSSPQAGSASHSPVPRKVIPVSFQDEEEDDSVSVTISVSFSFSATSTHGDYEEGSGPEHSVWKASTGTMHKTVAGQDEGELDEATASVKPEKKHTWAVRLAVGTALPAEDGKYKMPVATGITVEKKIGKYLGMEAGLAYSHLCSDGRKLHYVGVPVRMNVYPVELKKVDFYASVGTIADKCMAGAGNNSFKNEPIQWAVTAGVGVNYRINDRMALFAESGVSHHFDTDSQLETIRTKRPTNFNLMCGLRMTY